MNSEDIKNTIIRLIEKLNEPDYICYSTKENIDKVKEYLPKNIEACIVPDSFFSDEMKDKIYIIPSEYFREIKYEFGL